MVAIARVEVFHVRLEAEEEEVQSSHHPEAHSQCGMTRNQNSKRNFLGDFLEELIERVCVVEKNQREDHCCRFQSHQFD